MRQSHAIHSVILAIFIEYLRHVSHCPRCWGYGWEQSRDAAFRDLVGRVQYEIGWPRQASRKGNAWDLVNAGDDTSINNYFINNEEDAAMKREGEGIAVS